RFVGAANGVGRVRLNVESIKLAGAAYQHELDAIYIFVCLYLACGFDAEKLRQRKAQHADRAGVEEVSAGNAVAEVDPFIGIQPKHDRPLSPCVARLADVDRA